MFRVSKLCLHEVAVSPWLLDHLSKLTTDKMHAPRCLSPVTPVKVVANLSLFLSYRRGLKVPHSCPVGWVEKLSGLADLGRASPNPHFQHAALFCVLTPAHLGPHDPFRRRGRGRRYLYTVHTHTWLCFILPSARFVPCLSPRPCPCKLQAGAHGTRSPPKSQQHFDQRSRGHANSTLSP